MKKIYSLLLAICMVSILAVPALAADTTTKSETASPPFKVLHGTFKYDPPSSEKDTVEASTARDANPADEVGTNDLPFTVLHGTFVYDPPKENEMLRASTRPTSYAPNSWYNVDHYWTATSYTWSSYIFDVSKGYFFDCRANQKFSVEFYNANGTYRGTVVSDYWDYIGKQSVWIENAYENNYYVKIVNNSSSSITSGATYKAYF